MKSNITGDSRRQDIRLSFPVSAKTPIPKDSFHIAQPTKLLYQHLPCHAFNFLSCAKEGLD